ncbi:NTP transferase domain-containing protein [Altererythrobacter indicus]|uniref:NTP transferase domain-containing protein n=1 Tax=Altericroceibacterium indicum TaxID=374177 RepID=A0A845A912_9SPHN|nr:nucleotidyltransferase family protein [Altericroceibacterium indicum]MXP26740.1 NTP transferase domain-containing protein [Altericroceibacterium indicum]
MNTTIPTASDGWTAIVLAGRRPGIDPLAAHFGKPSKALIPVAGEAMLSRVLRVLRATPEVNRIVVLTQDVEELASAAELAWVQDDSAIGIARSGATISGSVLDFLQHDGTNQPILLTTADNVLLTPEIASYFINKARAAQLSVGLVSRGQLEKDYGQSQRTWWRFGDGDFSGANLFALQVEEASDVQDALLFWEKIEQDRKKVWKIAARFGPLLMLRIALRRLSLNKAVREAGRRLHVDAQAVALPFGRAAIDVDKLSDHAMAEKILSA